jgi:hypothetical protein
MVAGAIHTCGAFGGKLGKGNMYNRKGMFENGTIRNSIVKDYLRKNGWDTKCQYPLPDVENLPIPGNWRSRVVKAINSEGYQEGPWFYKGAKMCLMWPVWAHAFPDAKWIIVRRRTGDIISSCINTGFMDAFSKADVRKAVGAATEEEGWLWWVHQHEQRFVEMINAGLNVRVVWPERMVRGDYKQLYETIEWLGLEWNSKVLGFIDPKLWKVRRKMKARKV